MSKVFIEEETLLGIGNAIREKNGTTDLIATTDMAQTIINLPTGGPAETIKINSIARASNTSFNVGQYVGDATDFVLFFYKKYNRMYGENIYILLGLEK